jgi:hypothetical protein
VWAKRGSRPRAPRDRRYDWAYLFGAVCPERSTGAAVIMPEVNIEAMNVHLAEISRCVSVGAIALLVLDGAGWHSSPRLNVPDNVVLLPLPPYAQCQKRHGECADRQQPVAPLGSPTRVADSPMPKRRSLVSRNCGSIVQRRA